ncbi:ROK family transcriptional regulator [Breoghania sp. L-A4]|uniref:ROK family transcriptional regulator n=1 Tax=Breoghania sp. L-A4 TaxID=2304600 RepID=UPI000E35FFBA|nr:ROK family transcriptional regulator [Breoghania sp. L-A4]AXS42212.1 ROK family transcriptional regulator [Breoghania sp. L-A4]
MRGGDTTGLRAYNERLIMSALRRAGALSKAEIARETGLSGQAASVIVSRLVDDGLAVKLDKVRGQVGQPSTPIAPNSQGAFSLGVKIGRRSIEAILVNLHGDVVDTRGERYAAPFPAHTIATAIAQTSELLSQLDAAARRRVVGIGIAMPGELQEWASELDLAPGALDGWRDADVADALAKATGLPTSLHNDATAACAAEMIAGDAITSRSALYIYLGTFIGGGVVLDGKLYRGSSSTRAPSAPCRSISPAPTAAPDN